jgi:hypothetical protein
VPDSITALSRCWPFNKTPSVEIMMASLFSTHSPRSSTPLRYCTWVRRIGRLPVLRASSLRAIAGVILVMLTTSPTSSVVVFVIRASSCAGMRLMVRLR